MQWTTGDFSGDQGIRRLSSDGGGQSRRRIDFALIGRFDHDGSTTTVREDSRRVRHLEGRNSSSTLHRSRDDPGTVFDDIDGDCVKDEDE